MPNAKRKQSSPVSADSLLAAIVESSDDAIISTDLDGKITSWNPAAKSIFGYAAAEAMGQPLLMLIPPKDGKLIDVSVTISPIKDAEGDIIGASKIARLVPPQNR